MKHSYDYIEHESVVGLKMVVFHDGFDNYHAQIIDGCELFLDEEGMSGDAVSRLAKCYGFELGNPNARGEGIVEFQFVGHRASERAQ